MYEYYPASKYVEDYILENSDNQVSLNRDRLTTHASDLIAQLCRRAWASGAQRIKLIEVDNYSFTLPDDFVKLDELSGQKIPFTEYDRRRIITDIHGVIIGNNINCEHKCPKECDPCSDCDRGFLEINITPRIDQEYMHEYIIGRKTYGNGDSKYHYNFELMTANTSPYTFTNYHIQGCRNLICDNSKLTYKIDFPKVITSFSSGLVLLSYYGMRLNEDGEPLLLGTPKAFEVLNYYLDEKLAYNEYRRTKSDVSFKHHLAIKQLRLDAQRLLLKDIDPFSVKTLWAETKKHLQTRAGRNYDYMPLKY